MLDFILVNWLAFYVEFQLVFRSPHPKYFEPVYLWDELRRSLWIQVEIGLHKTINTRSQEFGYLQKNVRETGAEVRPINV